MVKHAQYILFSLVIPVLMLCISACSEPSADTIAMSGNREITWDLLRRSYHLQPKWGKGLTEEESYKNQINYLVDQKLFAQAAETDGLPDKDSKLKDYITFIYEKELIKGLYNKVVASLISITDEELHEAFRKSKMRVRFQYIKSPDSLRAAHYLAQMNTAPFDKIIPEEPANDEKGTSPMVKFGDVDEAVENVIFTGSIGPVEHIVRADNAWYALKVIDGNREVLGSKNEFEANRSKLHKIIFDRKASGISQKYIAELMRGKSVRLNPPVFNIVSEHFSRLTKTLDDQSPLEVNISNKELKSISNDLSSVKNEDLVMFKDGAMTVGEFLKTLANMPAGLRPQLNMAFALKRSIGQIVRNRYLVRQALEAGIASDDVVQFEYEQARDEVLARAWLKKQQQHISIADAELNAFRGSRQFATLSERMSTEPTSEQIYNIIFDLKFNQHKSQLADSLRGTYPVTIDEIKLISHLKNPKQKIIRDPVAFYYRENFF